MLKPQKGVVLRNSNILYPKDKTVKLGKASYRAKTYP